ncbi:Small ubiquitin-related modifier [Lachnellula suecica]|uniref:Small ubiquitin-related modifier n=1 Tax=Lachnellula suecica TaxID=602035 RepID=A0A8T9CGS9_9HELO|nr:Small ubiquitin-related modifier [Lachnellula suecica]
MSDNGSPAPSPAKEEKPEVKHIQVMVKDQHGNETFFKIKPITPMKKVMDAYCQSKQIDRGLVRFLFEGSRIVDADTPDSLEMDDDNMIDVVLEQIGGL